MSEAEDDEAREVEHEFYYTIPPQGWTCFHCGDTFTTPGAARDHFGFDMSADPACRIKIGEERGLVMELRRVEAKYVKLLEDSWEGGGTIAQEFYGLGAKHQIEMRKAEEEGYRKGLRDGLTAQAQLVEACRLAEPYVDTLHDLAGTPQGKRKSLRALKVVRAAIKEFGA